MRALLLGIIFSVHACCPGLAAISASDKSLVPTTQLLDNPGFESGTSAWVASGGTFTTTSTNPAFGSRIGVWDSSSASQTLCQTKAIPDGYKGNNGVAHVWLRTASGTATHKLRITDGTNTLTETDVISSTNFTVVPSAGFIFPSSGNIVVCLVSVAANEPSIDIDSFTLNFYSLFAVPVETTYTAKVSSAGVVSDETGGDWVNGNFAITSTSVFTGTYNAGFFTVAPNCVVTSASTSSATIGKLTTTGATSTAVQVYTYNTGSSAAEAAPFIVSCTKAGVDYTAAMSSSGFTAGTSSMSWTGYHDNTCSFARTNTAYGDPTPDASCAFTERTNTNFGTVSALLSGSDDLPGFTFTPRMTGKIEVCAQYPAVMSATTDGAVAMLLDSTIFSEQGFQMGDTTERHGNRICGQTNITSLTAKTIKLQTKAASGSITLSPSTAASTIEWSIKFISAAFPAPLIKQALVQPSTGVERVARATIECDGSSQVISQSGTWITAIGNISSGQCTITMTGFSAEPTCVLGYDGGFTTAVVVSAEVSSLTTIATDCATSPSTACSSYIANLICIGPN